MKSVIEVLDELGISKQRLYTLMEVLKIKPEQRNEKGNLKNYFSADQVRALKEAVG